MEGINVAAILLGYLGVLVFALASLVAFGLLVGRKTRAARILFASGLLAGVLLIVGAAVWLAAPDVRQGWFDLVAILSVACLLVAGVGQFIAGLRGPKVYAATLACAIGSAMAWLLLGGGDYLGPMMVSRSGPVGLAFVSAGVLMALASLLIAVSPFRSRQQP